MHTRSEVAGEPGAVFLLNMLRDRITLAYASNASARVNLSLATQKVGILSAQLTAPLPAEARAPYLLELSAEYGIFRHGFHRAPRIPPCAPAGAQAIYSGLCMHRSEAFASPVLLICGRRRQAP